MALSWTKIELSKLIKDFDIENQARIDGSNNVPLTESNQHSPTETAIHGFITQHYKDEVAKSLKDCESIEVTIDSCRKLTQANGHTELFAGVKTNWANIKADFELKLARAKENLDKSIENLRAFRVQNNIIAGREPHIRSNWKLFASIIIPIAFAATEITANTLILSPVTGGGEAIAASVMVSVINVGLAFMVGRMCLTNLFHPVGTSSSKGYYITLVVIFLIVVVYVNFMMGVFRGINEEALLATDREAYAAVSREALFAAVFPFNDLDRLTFQSMFLVLVGFFFATASLLDGYFFDDPINGYGPLGRKNQRAQNKYDELVNSVTDLVGDYSKSSFDELDKKRDERRTANSRWGNIMNMLQGDVSEFENFTSDTKDALLNSFETYRIKNRTFRSTDAPSNFNNPPDTSFIKTFAEEHKSIAFEIKTDEEKLAVMDANNKIIMEEYDETHAKYVEFFDSERKLMFDLVS